MSRGSTSSGDIAKLYGAPFPASREGAFFNAFSYPTKISPEAIAVFVAAHTKVGATVLDTFAGSGTTGIACQLCDSPTPEMLRIAAQLGLSPTWGPRNAVLVEVGTLGSFVSETLCSGIDPIEFTKAAQALIRTVAERIAHVYAAADEQGNEGTMRHAVWSDVLVCPSCSNEVTLWKAAVRFSPLRWEETFSCPTCHKKEVLSKVSRATELYADELLGCDIIRKKRTIVQIAGTTGGRKWIRSASTDDETRYLQAASLPLSATVPVMPIRWGELFRSGYHVGISHLHHFYTRRNLLVIGELWDQIQKAPPHLQSSLRLLVLSYNSSHSTLMTRVVFKAGQKNLVLTGAQSGVLYISGLPVEKNVLIGLQRKVPTIAEAFKQTSRSRSHVTVINGSSTKLAIEDKSVDYVFTDPPFGGYIPYAEVNQVNEGWLTQQTRREDELIISASQGKSIETYGNMMTSVFAEVSRVLKPRGKVTVVFHSAKAEVWQALVKAFTSAGFSVAASSVLDKLQESFKQVVSQVSVKGDPLILLTRTKRKPASEDMSLGIAQKLITTATNAQKDTKRGVRDLFSAYISECLARGVPVTLDAQDFYALTEEFHNKVGSRAK